MKSSRIYILDPGHGGLDPHTGQYVTLGKRSPRWSDGSIYYEGVGNRAIAQLVANKLKALDIAFDFTVKPSDHTDLGLTKRANTADAIGKKAGKQAVLISIHSNGASTEQANGFEVFTSPGQTSSDKYADVLYSEIKNEFTELKGRPDSRDGDFDKEEKFTVLTASKCPAVLIESMFHTNENECKILMSSAGKERVANAIVNAIKIFETWM